MAQAACTCALQVAAQRQRQARVAAQANAVPVTFSVKREVKCVWGEPAVCSCVCVGGGGMARLRLGRGLQRKHKRTGCSPSHRQLLLDAPTANAA